MTDTQLLDPFQRRIRYLRLSITDRCDFRCVYCMAEDMQFLPRREVLSLEEFTRVAQAFVALGVEKIRITGGEPLVRRDCLTLVRQLVALPGLRELCMTTNGSQLESLAAPLAEAGLHKINVSLDTLRPERFRAITRTGELATVLRGIDAAQRAGMPRLKINSVLMRRRNFDEAADLARFALERDMDISFIEEMPLGEISSHDRALEFVSSAAVREALAAEFQLRPDSFDSGGPSRYWRAEGYRGRIGFISPHSHNFCGDCNRVRVTAEGRLLLCLGNEDSVDLKRILRGSEGDEALKQAICKAMLGKPERHHFSLHEAPQILRFMNTTGG